MQNIFLNTTLVLVIVVSTPDDAMVHNLQMMLISLFLTGWLDWTDSSVVVLFGHTLHFMASKCPYILIIQGHEDHVLFFSRNHRDFTLK